MTPEACEFGLLKEWIKNSKPNEKFTYYTGYGTTDSIVSSEISAWVYKKAVAGEIYLVRRRSPQDRRLFDYIAIKASPTPIFSLLPRAKDDDIMERVKLKIGVRNYVRKVAHSSEV